MKRTPIAPTRSQAAPERHAVLALAITAAMAAAGCASTGPAPGTAKSAGTAVDDAAVRPPPAAVRPPAKTTSRRGGAFYLDDGPGDNPPPNLDTIPDAEPRSEPLHRFANRPYVVFGRSYTPMTERVPYRARGVATWYGKRYHAQKTSSGEVYNMYEMTGAHPTLPIPSYVRVTNVANGRQVVVRINDRGPFIGERLIDLSYAAAFRLGYVEAGSATVDVEKLIPGINWPADTSTLASRAPVPRAAAPTVAPRPPSQPLAEAAVPVPPAAVTAPASPDELPARTGALPLAAESGGVFLQLGAFGDRNNAETFIGRIRPELGDAAKLAHVHQSRGLHRIHIGPYASEREARAAAESLMRRLNIKPVLAVR
ncbi:MAG: septal ring lytic transglycosylase RlpA family protein [bacterium]